MFDELKCRVKKEFLDFADSFLTDDPVVKDNISLKREHSLRVLAHAEGIGASLLLDPELSFLLYCSSLLHDCGRFPQFAKYRTYHDQQSVDHGLMGASVIDKGLLLPDIDTEMISIIRDVVQYHNRWVLPDGLCEKSKFLLSVVRDADKLDIMFLMTEHFKLGKDGDPHVVLHLPDTQGCNPEVYKALMEGRTITNNMRHNLNDMKLGYMAWVYDLNYAYSVRHVMDNNMLDALLMTLPENDDFRKAYNLVSKYVEKRCGF